MTLRSGSDNSSMSHLVFGFSTLMSSQRPSGETLDGSFTLAELTSRSSAPVPEEGFP